MVGLVGLVGLQQRGTMIALTRVQWPLAKAHCLCHKRAPDNHHLAPTVFHRTCQSIRGGPGLVVACARALQCGRQRCHEPALQGGEVLLGDARARPPQIWLLPMVVLLVVVCATVVACGQVHSESATHTQWPVW